MCKNDYKDKYNDLLHIVFHIIQLLDPVVQKSCKGRREYDAALKNLMNDLKDRHIEKLNNGGNYVEET